MPKKAGLAETVQLSVTLPAQSIEMMQDLERTGLFGTSRGEIARNLILAQLQHLAGKGLVQVRRPE
jgi:hypothetical protein